MYSSFSGGLFYSQLGEASSYIPWNPILYVGLGSDLAEREIWMSYGGNRH